MKELHYFDRFWRGEIPDDFVERYHEFCPRPEGAITGEWTPRYMFDHWSMRLLHEAAPEARILVILRDPIERFRSGLTMDKGFSLSAGKDLDRLATALARSAYADQLRRVFQFYPRDRVLVLQYERCTTDPVGEILRTWEFLELDPGSTPPTRPPEDVRPPSQKPDLSPDLRSDLLGRLRHDVDEVAELCPEIDVSLWKNFG